MRHGVYVASFLVDATAYGYFVLVPLHAIQAFGAAQDTLGYLGTAVTLIHGITCYASGKLSDRIGSARLYYAGLLVLGALALPVAYGVSDLSGLFLSNCLFGVGIGLFWPPLHRQLSLLACLPGSDRGLLWRSVGTFNCSWAAGIALGSLVIPGTFEAEGFKTSLVLLHLMLLAAAISLAAVRVRDPASSPDVEPRRVADGGRVMFLRLAWLANFAAYFTFQALYHVFPHSHLELGFSEFSLGVLLFLVGLARFMMFFVLRAVSGWQYSAGWLLGVELTTAAGLTFLAFSTLQAPFFALLPLVGLLSGLSAFSSLYYGLDLGSDQGKNSGLHEFIQALGMSSGPLICGWVGNAFPGWPGSILMCGALVVVLVAVAQLGALLRHRRAAGGTI